MEMTGSNGWWFPREKTEEKRNGCQKTKKRDTWQISRQKEKKKKIICYYKESVSMHASHFFSTQHTPIHR